MIVSCHQPAYLPWLGYLEKIQRADKFVFLDTVSYSKNSFDNRNKIVEDGEVKWLTIPIYTSGMLGQTYLQAKPSTPTWVANHNVRINRAYKDAKYFSKYSPVVEKLYSPFMGNNISDYSLADICWSMLQVFCGEFGIPTSKIVRSSSLGIVSGKSDLVLDICKKLEATEYYSGVMGKDYLDERRFQEEGIKIVYQDYHAPHNLSCIHQLMTEGATI